MEFASLIGLVDEQTRAQCDKQRRRDDSCHCQDLSSRRPRIEMIVPTEIRLLVDGTGVLVPQQGHIRKAAVPRRRSIALGWRDTPLLTAEDNGENHRGFHSKRDLLPQGIPQGTAGDRVIVNVRPLVQIVPLHTLHHGKLHAAPDFISITFRCVYNIIRNRQKPNQIRV